MCWLKYKRWLLQYLPAYGCYNPHSQWLMATKEYKAKVLPECEPYIIGLKDALPPYDQRFRGYFYDKVSFISQLNRMRMRYTVHPSFYVVHLPHHKSYSVDDSMSTYPAEYDKATAMHVLLSIAAQEHATAMELERLLKSGASNDQTTLFQAQVCSAFHFFVFCCCHKLQDLLRSALSGPP